MNIGDALGKVRRLKKMSQGELADLSNLNQSYLSQIENNKKEPNLKTLKSIANALDVPLPLIFLFSLDSSDLQPGKKELLEIIQPLFSKLLEDFIK